MKLATFDPDLVLQRIAWRMRPVARSARPTRANRSGARSRWKLGRRNGGRCNRKRGGERSRCKKEEGEDEEFGGREPGHEEISG